jgi:hypothetical protein
VSDAWNRGVGEGHAFGRLLDGRAGACQLLLGRGPSRAAALAGEWVGEGARHVVCENRVRFFKREGAATYQGAHRKGRRRSVRAA